MNLLPEPLHRLLLVALFLFFLCGKVPAQEIVATAGETLQSSTTTLDFTLGQLAITTETSSSVIITQGFHQSFEAIVEALAIAEEAVVVSTYPNPTRDFLTIASENDQEINYRIYSLMGSKVTTGKFKQHTQLNIEKFAKGTYQLLLTNAQNQLIQTFKIQFK